MRRPLRGRLALPGEPLLLAAALWAALQTIICLSGLSDASFPGLYLLSSLGAAVALAGLLLAPWRRRGAQPAGTLPVPAAAASALLLPAAVLLNGYAGAPGSAFSGQPVAPALLSPALTLLVVRGRRGWAASSALSAVSVLLVLRVTDGDSPLWAPETTMLVGPVLVWWVWGLVAARLRGAVVVDLARSDSAYALARERRARARERAEAHERRRALLEVAAVPLLEEVARAAGPPDVEVRIQLTAVERDLRAELRGRDLLDPDVRRSAAGARARGVKVDVVDHAPPSADLHLLPPLRALVAAALHSCSDGEITARRPPHGPVLTLVHTGSSPSMRAVHAAVASQAEGLTRTAVASVDVSADEDAVVVEVERADPVR